MEETLLSNILFLLFFALFYLLITEYKQTNSWNRVILVFISGLAIIFCMLFPIPIGNGFIFDLRYIPFIIASLYGGFFIAIPLYILLNIVRFIIGGPGWLPSLLISSLALVTVPFLHTTFLALAPHKKALLASGVAFIHVVLYISALSFFFTSLTIEFFQTTAIIATIQTIGTLFISAVIILLLTLRTVPTR
ncbi:LytS/YhcK type 5TM receptor domain-containing protein [Bacillus sp. FJAT-45037]|uniref:LytS/YhcK type 5TM receptor domain-containing protein n=1 Tax=Bacillus sp. FJAT-45037 TaxID=2011007 RepID=UPI000C23B261|nr:LytS/YhcK type 5TM receptor domain-containing protein [Bacillus sp. FJAT-45037]